MSTLNSAPDSSAIQWSRITSGTWVLLGISARAMSVSHLPQDLLEVVLQGLGQDLLLGPTGQRGHPAEAFPHLGRDLHRRDGERSQLRIRGVRPGEQLSHRKPQRIPLVARFDRPGSVVGQPGSVPARATGSVTYFASAFVDYR